MGALHRPKNITIGSDSPSGVMNTALYWSPSLIQMLLYLACMSNFIKVAASSGWLKKLSINSSGYVFLTVTSFKAW